MTSVTPNPSTQNAAAGYSVKFTTGSGGALSVTPVPDSIRVVFPMNTYIPATVSKNDVTVNGTHPTTNPRVGTGADTNTVIIPIPADIGAG